MSLLTAHTQTLFLYPLFVFLDLLLTALESKKKTFRKKTRIAMEFSFLKVKEETKKKKTL